MVPPAPAPPVQAATPVGRDPAAPDRASHAVMTEDAAAPPPPREPFAGAPGHEIDEARGTPGADPEAGVDTTEISLAELQAAARRAQAAEPTDTAPREVDLVEAERREALGEDVEVPAGESAPAEPDAGVAVDPDAPGDAESPGRSPIDPRIRERRVAVTRAEGRRRLRILLTAVCVASAIGIAWLVVQSPLLAVDTVNVKGTSPLNQPAVRTAAGVKTGTALLFVDTGSVAKRVEALPWVASAKVSRQMPNDLTITVVERVPVAWVRRPALRGSPHRTLGAVALIDRFGRVVSDAPAPPPGVPEIRGIHQVPARGGRIRPAASASALAQLPAALRAETTALTMHGGQGVLELGAVSGGAQPTAGEVRLGDLEQMGPKGASALAVLDALASEGHRVRYIDVRVPNAPATR
jgi:cell division protein FtsQ